VPSTSALAEKRGPGGFQFNRQPNPEEKWSKKNEQQGGGYSVKNDFEERLPSAGTGGTEDKQITIHDFLKLSPGNLGAYEVRAEPTFHTLLLTGFDSLSRPPHVFGVDVKENDPRRIFMDGMDKGFDGATSGRERAGDANADG